MIRDLVELAHEYTSAAAFEAGALALLRREIGFDVAFATTKGAEATPTTSGLDTAAVAQLVAGGETYARELAPVKRAALAARGVAVDTTVLGSRRVGRMRYHRDVAARVDGRHSLLAYVPWRGRIIAALMLGRTSGTFSEREIRRIERVLPTLGVARVGFGLPPAPLSPPPPALVDRLGLRRNRVIATADTGQGTLTVRDRDGFREMVAPGGLVWTRAALADPSESGWPYIELFHLAAALARHRRRALFVGCGGAVALRQFARVYPGIHIDLVEREPAVIALANTHYDMRAIPNLTAHVADGVAFIENASPAAWDVIVVDAYDDADLAAPLSARSFFAAMGRALSPGGAMAFNVIGSLDGRGPLRRVMRAAGAELDALRLVPVMALDERCSPHALRNVVVIGRRAS